MPNFLDSLKWDGNGLVTAIVQASKANGAVLLGAGPLRNSPFFLDTGVPMSLLPRVDSSASDRRR